MTLSQLHTYGQGCSCPPIATCGCEVGLTKLRLQYTGLLGITVNIRDTGGIIHTGLLLLPGSTIEIESSAGSGQPFVGDRVMIIVTLVGTTVINTSCTTPLTPVTIGSTFGNLRVMAGESVGGVPICCQTMETTPPVINDCPSDVTVSASTSSCGAGVNWTPPTVSDNCAVSSFTSSHTPGDFFPVGGPTPVTYTATDNYGNVSTCSFTVTVTDNTAPVFSSCPTDITVSSDASLCGANVNWTPPTTTDNCTAIPTLTSDYNPGAFFPVGTTTVHYEAKDAAGNINNICTFTVTVTDNTAPTITDCPTNITVSSDASLCGANVNWTPPTTTDNCTAIPTLTSDYSPGAFFPVGITTVHYEAKDAAGNINNTCTFTVTVLDNTAPTITDCPTDITVSSDASLCGVNVSWTPPTTTDNCTAIPTLTSDYSPGAFFPVGTTTVHYEAKDAAGNINNTCTFTVTVTDNTAPTITDCPTNITVSSDASLCGANVSWTPPTTTDNCVAIPTLTSDYGPGAFFPVGSTTVHYEAKDAAGNINSTCTFTVTVLDDTAPSITDCPTDITVSSDASLCGANVSWTPPTTADNCMAIPTLTSDYNPGAFFPVGTTTVHYEARDAAGNINGTCTFTVTVLDNTAPTITGCPTDITVSSDASLCGANVSWTPPTSADNCTAIPTLTSDYNPGAFFPVGTTTVHYEAKDAAGNINNTCTFTVTVTDNTAPTITGCPTNITVSSDASLCGANVSWTPPTTTDNCTAIPTLTSDYSPGAFFPVGTTTVHYEAKDAAGNINSTCTFTVTVLDDTAPSITDCPTDITVSSDASLCGVNVSWTPPTTTDNCTAIPTLTSDYSPGAFFPVGTTTVHYEAKDAAGNINNTCTFTVTVLDNTAPTITGCPTDITVSSDASLCGANVSWTPPAATDNCTAIPTLTSDYSPGAFFPVGITTVHYEAKDATGNINNTCTFTVTVLDNAAPTITDCPTDITVSSDASLCGVNVSWTPPTTTDNCTAIPTLTSDYNPGDFFPVGTTTVHYEAKDAAGNINNTCTFTVTVTDNTAPTITGCPTNITVSSDASLCGANVNWTPPTTTDNCTAIPTLTSDYSPGSFFPIGTTTVHYEAKDAVGNINNTCTFTVTVTDNTAPTITDCPTNITVSSDAALCGANVSWTPPTTADNCTAIPTLTSDYSPGAFFPVGTTTVHYEAKDAAGNINNTCTFTVTVTDNTAPVFANCPTDITVSSDASSCGANVSWTPPTTTDNCTAIPTLTSDYSPGAFFPVGTTTVHYEAKDAAGNINNTCTFTVTVIDNTAPVFANCPTDITVSSDASSCGANVSWTPPTTTDNCTAIPTLTSDYSPGAFFPVGTTTVHYEARDAAGNVNSTCTFTVTVTDNTAPVITGCPTDITVSSDASLCGANVSWTPPTTTDNCTAIPTLTSDYNPGAFFPVGTTTVHYEAKDAAGNINSTCTFTVTVLDDTAPSITDCPTDITVSSDASLCGANVSWTPPTTADNCMAIPTLTSDYSPGAFFPVGITTVHYEAKDAVGNINNTCTFTVTVTDNTAPTITDCPTNITVSSDAALCGANVSWTPPTTADNCTAIPTLTSDYSPGAFFPVGTTTVHYEAKDAAGNINNTCTFTVTVTDNTAPTITGCPTNITVSSDASLCGANVSWTPPTTTDNCTAIPTLTSDYSPGSFFPIGTTTVHYEAKDAVGNINNTCTFTVTVTDNTAPVIAGCPTNITVSSDASLCGANVSWTPPTTTDNCVAIPTLTSDYGPGAFFPVGSTTVHYEAKDAAGNINSTCTFTVTVLDDTAPSITDCPTDITVSSDAALCGASVSWTPPTSADNCTAIPTLTSDYNPGAFFPVGTTTVHYEAKDAAGNINNTCIFTVTVIDNTAPVFANCPTDITVSSDASSCGTNVSWTPPIATDNCSVTLSSNHSPGEKFSLGTTSVTYTATDRAGNNTTCSFNVTVSDNTGPVISGCPANISIDAATSCGAVVNWTPPTVTDCSTFTVTNSYQPGDMFPVGNTEVTYTITDNKGNSSSCKFDVVVFDNTPPVLLNCPSEILTNTNNTCQAVATWIAPTAIDNCEVASITSTYLPGSTFPMGITGVEYKATDIYGNVSFCRFDVVVKSAEMPVITGCPDDILAQAGESEEVSVTWEPPTVTTHCSNVSLASSHEPGAMFGIGTTIVEYKAIDDSGNTLLCTFNVTVAHEDPAFDIAKVVTPDGDGSHDQWIISNIEEYSSNRVVIVDRWGSVIYKASGYNNNTIAWNGADSKGELVPTGTYFYVLEIDVRNTRVKRSGFIELIH